MKLFVLLVVFLPSLVLAADDTYTLTIKNHQFEPAQLTVPAGKKIKLLIENKDSTPEEFESHALNREKVIAGNGQITLFIGPLSAGQYSYVGEFNEATAKGVIIAK